MKPLIVILFLIGCLLLGPQYSLAAPITPGSFSTIWKTDNPGNSAPNQVTIYTYLAAGGTYDYDVYWEEVGNESNNGTTSATDLLTIDFPYPGTYRIDITGDFPAFFPTGEAQKILSVEQWGDIEWRTMDRAFYGAYNLRINAVDAPDLSLVTNVDSMFCNATSMNDPIGHWDVSNVTNMGAMFRGATSFNQSLDN